MSFTWFACRFLCGVTLLSIDLITLSEWSPSQSRFQVRAKRGFFWGQHDVNLGTSISHTIRNYIHPRLHRQRSRQHEKRQAHHDHLQHTRYRQYDCPSHQWSFFQILINLFLGYFDPKNKFFDSKNKYFSGWPKRYFG